MKLVSMDEKKEICDEKKKWLRLPNGSIAHLMNNHHAQQPSLSN